MRYSKPFHKIDPPSTQVVKCLKKPRPPAYPVKAPPAPMTNAPTQPTAVAINARPIPAPSPNAKPPIRLPPLSTSMSFCRSLGSVPIKQALRGPQVVRQPRQRVPSLIIVLAFGNIPCLVRLIKAGNLTYQRSVGSEGNVQAMSHGRAGTDHKRGYQRIAPLEWPCSCHRSARQTKGYGPYHQRDPRCVENPWEQHSIGEGRSA